MRAKTPKWKATTKTVTTETHDLKIGVGSGRVEKTGNVSGGPNGTTFDVYRWEVETDAFQATGDAHHLHIAKSRAEIMLEMLLAMRKSDDEEFHEPKIVHLHGV